VIVACGPESNGTKLLARILETSGERVVHRSLPYDEDWWHYGEFPKTAKFVVILRQLDPSAESAFIAGHTQTLADAYEEQRLARSILAEIPRALVVTYEHLVSKPDEVLGYLKAHLKLDNLHLPEELFDGNAKYRSKDG
jgi:hypothetical protein